MRNPLRNEGLVESSETTTAGGVRGDQAAAAAVEREFTVAQRSQTRMILRHQAAVVSLVVFVAVVGFAFVGPLLWRYSYTDITADESVAPSLKHPFGTTSLGKDELALVMRGTQRSIEIANMLSSKRAPLTTRQKLAGLVTELSAYGVPGSVLRQNR